METAGCLTTKLEAPSDSGGRIDYNLFDWSLQKGIEIPKFNDPTAQLQYQTLQTLHLQEAQRLSSVAIYADDAGTLKTDHVVRWVLDPHYRHSVTCELMRSRRLSLPRDLPLLRAEANLRCEFCGDFPIHVAALLGDSVTLEALLAAGAQVNAVNCNRESALHVACGGSDLEFVGRLLANGANVNLRDNSGILPLHICLAKCHGAGVEALLHHGARHDLLLSDTLGLAPLHLAIKKGFGNIARILVDHGADMDQRTSLGVTPVALAVLAGDESILAYLLTRGAGAHWVLAKGRTALHLACEFARETAARLLLEAGARADLADETATNCLHLAARVDCPGLVRLLFRNGCDVNALDRWSRSPLHVALISNQPRTMRMLLDYGARTDDLATPLQRTVRCGFREAVCLLLKWGMPADLPDARGQTALCAAVKCGDLLLASDLLGAGADPNVRGSRPLVTEAVLQANAPMVRLLLSRGADPCALDETFRTPVHHALALNNPAVLAVFQETGIGLVFEEAARVSLGLYGAAYNVPAPSDGSEAPLPV